MSSSDRARPLSPDDRKRAIIEAVSPLLIERGAAVTSRDMADVAGIAEGTIFRVFPDKRAIIVEAVRTAMDPAPVVAELAAISRTDPLDAQLEAAATVLLDRIAKGAALIGALRSLRRDADQKPRNAKEVVLKWNAAILDAITDLFEPHADRLSVPPAQAALAFRGIVLVTGHPMLMSETRPDEGDIVNVFLHGVLA